MPRPSAVGSHFDGHVVNDERKSCMVTDVHVYPCAVDIHKRRRLHTVRLKFFIFLLLVQRYERKNEKKN